MTAEEIREMAVEDQQLNGIKKGMFKDFSKVAPPNIPREALEKVDVKPVKASGRTQTLVPEMESWDDYLPRLIRATKWMALTAVLIAATIWLAHTGDVSSRLAQILTPLLSAGGTGMAIFSWMQK